MHLTIAMSLTSPWSRRLALEVKLLGHEVTVVDIGGPTHGYLTTNGFQQKDVQEFVREIADVRIAGSGTSKLARYALCAHEIRRSVSKKPGSMILATYAGGYGMAAYMSGMRPYAVYAVGSDVLSNKGRILSRVFRRTLEHASVVLANGKYLAERTRAAAPNAHVIPHYIGVDVKRFEINGMREVGRIVCTRGFSSVYNNHYLIDIARALGERGRKFNVVFTSTGPELNMVREYARRTLRPEIAACITFLGGVSEDRLVAELQRADLYVSVSRSDGTSISLLEAFAAGAYPILADIPQNKEWQRNGNIGLIPLENACVAADLIASLLTPAIAKERAREFNRNLVEDQADLSNNMAKMISIIQESTATLAD